MIAEPDLLKEMLWKTSSSQNCWCCGRAAMPCACCPRWLLAIREEKSRRLHVRADDFIADYFWGQVENGTRAVLRARVHVQRCPPCPGCLQTARGGQRSAEGCGSRPSDALPYRSISPLGPDSALRRLRPPRTRPRETSRATAP